MPLVIIIFYMWRTWPHVQAKSVAVVAVGAARVGWRINKYAPYWNVRTSRSYLMAFLCYTHNSHIVESHVYMHIKTYLIQFNLKFFVFHFTFTLLFIFILCLIMF
jgi:hypothetical protein